MRDVARLLSAATLTYRDIHLLYWHLRTCSPPCRLTCLPVLSSRTGPCCMPQLCSCERAWVAWTWLRDLEQQQTGGQQNNWQDSECMARSLVCFLFEPDTPLPKCAGWVHASVIVYAVYLRHQDIHTIRRPHPPPPGCFVSAALQTAVRWQP